MNILSSSVFRRAIAAARDALERRHTKRFLSMFVSPLKAHRTSMAIYDGRDKACRLLSHRWITLSPFARSLIHPFHDSFVRSFVRLSFQGHHLRESRRSAASVCLSKYRKGKHSYPFTHRSCHFEKVSSSCINTNNIFRVNLHGRCDPFPLQSTRIWSVEILADQRTAASNFSRKDSN